MRIRIIERGKPSTKIGFDLSYLIFFGIVAFLLSQTEMSNSTDRDCIFKMLTWLTTHVKISAKKRAEIS